MYPSGEVRSGGGRTRLKNLTLFMQSVTVVNNVKSNECKESKGYACEDERVNVCEVPSLCPHTWTSHGHVWCAAGLPLGTHLLPKVRRVMQVKGV